MESKRRRSNRGTLRTIFPVRSWRAVAFSAGGDGGRRSPEHLAQANAHAPSTASAFLVEQGYGVRDARDEPAQAGEQQQFFDLPDHDVLPGEGPGDSNEERELGFHA